MPENPPPEHWYQFNFPLEEVEGAPVPSNADYSQENVAWLIEMFGGIIGTGIELRYENNTPQDEDDDIIVSHPEDREYYPDAARCKDKSPEMIKYEEAAKRSDILKTYQDNSPANITYFEDNDECIVSDE